jgi:hypothetical protein
MRSSRRFHHALETGATTMALREQYQEALRQIVATLDAALYMGGFNAPFARSVAEWRTALEAIMAP